MGQRVDEGHIGARFQGQVVLGFHMGASDQVNLAWVSHDELGATAQSALHARGKHGMRIGRVGANHQQDIGVFHRFEGLRAGRCAKGKSQTIAGGRMANAGTSIHVVGAKGGAYQLLHKIGFFVGAA